MRHRRGRCLCGRRRGSFAASLPRSPSRLPRPRPRRPARTRPNGPSLLPEILRRAGQLPASHADRRGGAPAGADIYIAPPDHHLLVSNGPPPAEPRPAQNGHRPAVDPLFRSAAAATTSQSPPSSCPGCSPTARSASLREGGGGAALVQDPDEALYASMPTNAIAYTRPDYVIGSTTVIAVVRFSASAAGSAGRRSPRPIRSRSRGRAGPAGRDVPFTCPEAEARCGRRTGRRLDVPLPRRTCVHDSTTWRPSTAKQSSARSGRRTARWRSGPRCPSAWRAGCATATGWSRRSDSSARLTRRGPSGRGAEGDPRAVRSFSATRISMLGLGASKLEDGSDRRSRTTSRRCSTTSRRRAASTSPATSARASQRRIEKRMQARRAARRTSDYRRLPRGAPGRVRRALQHDPDQRHGFFRDPAAWDYLRDEVVPRSCEATQPRRQPIRVWTPAARRARRRTRSRWCFAEALGRRRSASA